MFQGPLKRASPSEKCAYLLIWLWGQEETFSTCGILMHQTEKRLTLYTPSSRTTQTHGETFVFTRHVFQEWKQQPGEAFEHFVTDLRNMVKDWSYEKPDEMARDKTVSGITSQAIREKLYTKGTILTWRKPLRSLSPTRQPDGTWLRWLQQESPPTTLTGSLAAKLNPPETGSTSQAPNPA